VNPNSVIDGIGTTLTVGFPTTRVYTYATDRIEPPSFVVLVETIVYDATDRRNSDIWDFIVWAIVGRVSDRTARPALGGYLHPSTGVKGILEANKTLSGACDSLRVTEAEVSTLTIAGTEYLGAMFTVNVIG